MLKLALILGVSVCAITAYGKPPPGTDPDSPISQWFSHQVSVRGLSCCGQGDGHILEDNQWRIADDHTFEVEIEGKWIKIPPDRMRDVSGGPNPVGKAIVWFSSYDDEIHIYCFAEGWFS